MRIHAGIDIGKTALTVATTNPAAPPHQWPTATIHLTNPNWWRDLRAIIPPASLIVVEPTGTHYLTPIETALAGLNCQLWLINTTTTGKIRAVHISNAKSDRTDAQALALAAAWLADGRRIHGARPYGYDPTAHLRQLLNNHARTSKSLTRDLNRFGQLAHALWPALGQSKDTYLRAITATAAISPDDIRHLAARPDLNTIPGYERPQTRAALQTLARKLPPGLPAPDLSEPIKSLAASITSLQTDLARLETEIITEIQSPPFEEITRRWRTVPASSDLAIAALTVATRGNVLDFTRDQFRSAIGASPKRAQSGQRVTTAHTRTGYRPAMKNLYLWTLRLLTTTNRPNPVADYFDRAQTDRRMHAAVGKLAKILHAVARDPNGYDP